MRDPGGVLGRILAHTRFRLEARRSELPLERLEAGALATPEPRSLCDVLTRPGCVNVIAEFKRRSPSRGAIREDLSPAQAALAYERAGAAALSVLTEETFFGGSLGDLRQAHAASRLPTLRKDFVVDAYQVWEARHAGADAVLLIVAALSDPELRTLCATARGARLDALVEVHDREELARAVEAGTRIVGVNNRDLRTLEVDLATSFDLARLIPDDVVAVAESGIAGGEDVRRLREVGFDAFLIGEHLMQAPEPGAALETLLREAAGPRDAPWWSREAGPRVKVCGITRVEDALQAARAGADAIGLVFWPESPRRVDLATAGRIAAALPPSVLRVGVFADAPRDELARTAETVGLDLLQLHGEEPPDSLAGLPRPVLKAVRVGDGFRPEDALRYEGRARGILLDTRHASSPGGTGRGFDWSLAQAVREHASFLVLAGGLTPGNVGEAVRRVRPDAVDVSSGVERVPGVKDPMKVRAFIEAVKGER